MIEAAVDEHDIAWVRSLCVLVCGDDGDGDEELGMRGGVHPTLGVGR